VNFAQILTHSLRRIRENKTSEFSSKTGRSKMMCCYDTGNISCPCEPPPPPPPPPPPLSAVGQLRFPDFCPLGALLADPPDPLPGTIRLLFIFFFASELICIGHWGIRCFWDTRNFLTFANTATIIAYAQKNGPDPQDFGCTVCNGSRVHKRQKIAVTVIYIFIGACPAGGA